MIESAEEVILVVDSSKFGKVALVNVSPLEVVGKIVTDAGIPSKYKKLFFEQNTEVIIAS